jgi:hypothetical protein
MGDKMATKKSTELAIKTETLPGKMGAMFEEARILSQSGIIPAAYAGRPEAVFAVIQYGREFGIPPMSALQNIAFINGRPSMGTDLLMALIHRHPEFAGYSVKKYTDNECAVEIRRLRKNQTTPDVFCASFTIEEARNAGLVRSGSPWEKWRRRMLKHRACAFAARDAFPDVLSGNYSYEEMEPDKFAGNQDIEMRVLDEVEAMILEDKGVPVEKPPTKRAEPKAEEEVKVRKRKIT